MSKDELSAYYRHLDNTVILKDNIYTSRGEGMREGLEKGLEKGLKKGIKKGREETMKNIVKNIVKNLKSVGSSVEFISDVTGLTKEYIENL